MDAPAGYAERTIRLIGDVLNVEVPDAQTDLIDSGLLDSLALVSLIAEIEHEFGFDLPLDDFDIESFRTVARIAAFVAANEPSESPA